MLRCFDKKACEESSDGGGAAPRRLTHSHTALPKQGRVQLRCLCPLAQEALRFGDFKARREQAARCLQVIAGPVPLLAAGRAGAGACSAKRTGRVARGVYCESFN